MSHSTIRLVRRPRFKASLLLATLALVAVGCAHHRDVRPGTEGVNRIVIRGPDRGPLERDAIEQAEHYCEQYKKHPAFTADDTKYTGSGSEDSHKTMRGVSKAVTAGGGMVSVFGGDTERNTGRMATGAGVVGGMLTDQEAYTVDMRFKCE